MTLLEMANFICGKVNQTEAEDVTACKGFLTRRHDLIWNSELWKDALVEYRQTLDPDVADYTPASNYLPSKGVLLLPPIIQRVLGARTSTRTLNAHRPEYYYRIDFDAFAKTGTPAEYIILPAAVWELDSSYDVYAVRASSADAEAAVVAHLQDSDGSGITRTTNPLDEAYKRLGDTQLIDRATKPTTSGAVLLQAEVAGSTYGADLVTGNFGGFGEFYIRGVTLTIGETYLYTPGNESYLATSFPGDAIPAGEFVATAETYFLVTQNPALDGAEATATIQRQVPEYVTVSAAAADDTNFKRRQRVRFIEIPTTEQTIRVLGKRICPAFDTDNDEPAINGSENLLIALGSMDMMQRERQYGKAREYSSEAAVLMAELKKLEVVQQVHHHRIIPECGFGDDYFTGGRRGFHF